MGALGPARPAQDGEVRAGAKAEGEERGLRHAAGMLHEPESLLRRLEGFGRAAPPERQLGQARLHRADALSVHRPRGSRRDGAQLTVRLLEPAAREVEIAGQVDLEHQRAELQAKLDDLLADFLPAAQPVRVTGTVRVLAHRERDGSAALELDGSATYRRLAIDPALLAWIVCRPGTRPV